MRALFVMTIVAALAAGCTSIASKVGGTGDDGIAYYMPLRPIKITVTVDSDGKQTPTVDAGDSVPDISKRFILDYSQNYVGKNHMNIVVSAKGLLTTSNADTTSGVTAIAKNFGQLAGNIHALAGAAAFQAPVTPPAPKPLGRCDPGQTYTLLVFPEKVLTPTVAGEAAKPTAEISANNRPQLCHFSINISRSWSAPPTGDTESLNKSGFQSGVFYRHDLPYTVTLTDASAPTIQSSEYIAFSPDESEINFVAVSRTLFSDNKTNIGFTDGIVTSVDQSSDGELVALSELPADVIGAYFSAVGNIFSSLGTNTASEQTLITNQQELATAKVKKEACLAAISANDITGKTGADLSKAMDNIKSACS